MATSRESTAPYAATRETASLDVARLESWLPALLSVVAGMVDVIGYLSLKLFTAHVTGNLVVIAALVVRGGPPNIAQILAVPVFILAVAAVWMIAKASGKRGPNLARPLLLVQFLLLTGVLAYCVVYDPAAHPRSVSAGVATMIAVSAMACQFALLRLALPVAPSTAVMTGNLTNAVLSLLETLLPGDPLMTGPELRLERTLHLLVGFCIGCIIGAAALSWVGNWAWALPAVLAGVALVLR